jgi:hypothetical protein
MKDYEIRVIRKGTGATVYVSPQQSDFAAIRRARLLAEEGDIVEVWRGLNCVFTQAPKHVWIH